MIKSREKQRSMTLKIETDEWRWHLNESLETHEIFEENESKTDDLYFEKKSIFQRKDQLFLLILMIVLTLISKSVVAVRK